MNFVIPVFLRITVKLFPFSFVPLLAPNPGNATENEEQYQKVIISYQEEKNTSEVDWTTASAFNQLGAGCTNQT